MIPFSRDCYKSSDDDVVGHSPTGYAENPGANARAGRVVTAQIPDQQMSAPSRNPDWRDASSEVLWEDGERVFCRERRLGNDGKLRSVLIVRLAAEHPTPVSLDRLTHEYALRDELDGGWAVRPLELIHERGRTLLVFEDPASEPLDRLLGTPMPLGRFLQLAIAIAAALTQLHGARPHPQGPQTGKHPGEHRG